MSRRRGVRGWGLQSGEKEIKLSGTHAGLQSRLTPEEAEVQVAPFRRIGAELTIHQTESGEGGGSTANAAQALRMTVSPPGLQESVSGRVGTGAARTL